MYCVVVAAAAVVVVVVVVVVYFVVPKTVVLLSQLVVLVLQPEPVRADVVLHAVPVDLRLHHRAGLVGKQMSVSAGETEGQ